MTHSPLSQWADKQPGRWILVLSLGVFSILMVYGAMSASDDMAEMQAVADDKAAAELQAKQELIQQQKRHMTCGGPEATVEELPDGGWKCKNTDGRTTKIIGG